jgi:outer membrane protein
MKKSFALAALLGAAVMPVAAQAQDAGGIKAGDKLFRVRAIVVAPQESSGGIRPTFPGEEVKVTNSLAPEVDFTYMVTGNIGLELIAATTKHKAKGRTGTTGSIGKLASTWVLPPTLTAQYHFNPAGKVRPYVGAGVNYTLFYREKASDGLEDAVGETRVRMSGSFGPAIQAGVDFSVSPNMFVNLDAKWIDMDTTARLRTEAIGEQKVRVHLDPLVIGAGVGWRF